MNLLKSSIPQFVQGYDLIIQSINHYSALKKSYFTYPFKVLDVRENKKSNLLHLIVMSASPGMFNGDCYQLNLKISENCALRLQTQSFQHIFPSEQITAQKLSIHIEDGSYLIHVPHPVVPHKEAKHSSYTDIELHTNAGLLISDILSCGRKLNGEQFEFSYHQSMIQIKKANRLIYKDNILITPKIMHPQVLGHYEQFSHQGSLLVVYPDQVDLNQFFESSYQTFEQLFKQCFTQPKEAIFGFSKLDGNAIAIRALGQSGEAMYQLFTLFSEYMNQIFETLFKK